MKTLLVIAAGSILFLAACGGAAGTNGGTINATLTDNSIVLNQASVPSGKVTFNVKNTGTMVHELVVLQTNLAQDKIPADSAVPGKVLEDGSKGETGDMDIGATKTFTLDLAPGNYVLICNQPAHYLLGMHIALVVK